MAKNRKGLKGRPRDEEDFKRPIRFKNYQYFFLIVCEDQNTEPAYFKIFEDAIPENTLFLRKIGTGFDPKGVVEQTILEREKLKQESNKEVDASWAVFDKDDADENNAKIERFEKALSIAKDEKINLAFSNEVFELWLLLHLTNVSYQIPLPRTLVYQKLEEEIQKRSGFNSFNYQHGDSTVVDVIKKTGDEKSAIRRAEALLKYHAETHPVYANPSTRMHLLVIALREQIAFYSWKPDKG